MHALPELLDPEELLRIPDGDWYELLDGRPVEKVKGAYSCLICGHLAARLVEIVYRDRLGHVFPGRTGYQCFPGRPRHLRRPDISFVACGRFPDEVVPNFDILLPPDLCVEVVSPNETYEQIEERVVDFLAAGVRLFWIVSPEVRTILVRRPNKTSNALDVTDTLTGEDVLPGFTCPVAELFV
ncbi:MAG TPA: Uma2 family endonuclease [Gemmataceae bacterium]|nr:Uma2 family endonuclease [Gemmataceae bacterium]